MNMSCESEDSRTKKFQISLHKIPEGIHMREQELKDIFAMMIMKLDLREHPNDTSLSSFLNLKRKLGPYLFSTEKALESMHRLDLVLDIHNARTVLKYDISQQLASNLLCRFYEAKLLHCPSDRTRNVLKQGLILQPTPKGVAILVNFLSRTGIDIKKWPPIAFSSINTMDLFIFDRRAASDKILYSNYLLYLLFIRLMGNRPHIWSASTPPELVYYPCLTSSSCLADPVLLASKLQEIDTFDGVGEGGIKIPMSEFRSYFNFGTTEELLGSSSASSNGSNSVLQDANDAAEDVAKPRANSDNSIRGAFTVSPFYHRYFTNPESDSHVQYYVSSTGVRLFEGKCFPDPNGSIYRTTYCLSGKSICQWLCDCTDILYPQQARDVAELLVKAKLLELVPQLPVVSKSGNFLNDRNAFYCLTDIAFKTVQWKELKLQLEEVTDDFTSVALSYILKTGDCNNPKKKKKYLTETLKTFEDIMKDPGMRHLFRKHLENEYCSENLDAYHDLRRLEYNVGSLRKMIHNESGRGQKSINELVNIANSCLELAYRIYFIYVSSDAPFTLNIGHDSRNTIGRILVSSQELPYLQTPVAEMHFDFDAMEISNQENTQLDDFATEKLSFPKRAYLKHSPYSRAPNSSAMQHTTVTTSPTNSACFSAKSPTERRLQSMVNTIVRSAPVLKDIQSQIHRILVEDSVPKFLNSKLFHDANNALKYGSQ